MKFQILSVLHVSFLIALFHPALSISCADFHDGKNYSAYEAMLLQGESNLEALENGFFRTNYHSSIVVNIEYHFISSGSEEDKHNIFYLLADDDNKEPWLNLTAAEISHYHFRWVLSPVNLFIRPDLLTSLSLNTYQAQNVSIDLYLQLPFNCSPEILNRIISPSVSTCDHPNALLKQLNTLTANVSFNIITVKHGVPFLLVL